MCLDLEPHRNGSWTTGGRPLAMLRLFLHGVSCVSLVEQDATRGSIPGDAVGCDYSVIVPAYHGRETIADCLCSVLRAIEGRRGEVLVIESSGDGTAELVREQFPMIRVLALAERVSARGGSQSRC